MLPGHGLSGLKVDLFSRPTAIATTAGQTGQAHLYASQLLVTARICRQSCLRGALARDDNGSVVCCFSKAAYVAGIAGKDAVARRSEEYYGRVDRV